MDANGQPVSRLRVELLGPVRAWYGDRELALGPPLRQAVLAVLALRANRTVSRDEIIDAVWGGAAPASAANNLHIYVAAIRRLLSGSVDIPRTASVGSGRWGYLLRLEPGQLDVAEFDRHLGSARSHLAGGQPAGVVDALDAALGLWRGTPLSGLTGPFAEAQRVRLTERRLTAVEDRAEALLALAWPGQRDLVAELAELAEEYPLRERLRGLLMRALQRDGRRAEALAVYADTRRLLVDQLGIEPGPQLQQVQQAILADDGSPAPAALQSGRRPGVVPRQLPPPVGHFAGRVAELKALDELLGRPGAGSITGTAGVGKTALAVHWAYRVADRFPDGQLYVNLRGFDPTGTPVSSAQAVRGFLDALGAPPQQIPATLDAQVSLYRSLMVGRRVLVVLDNARDADQVRPLLLGTPGCLVLVTSRNELTSLVTIEAADPVTLEPPTEDEARELLAGRLGADRVAAEPDAVGRIIDRSARLPLALAIVAARAATRPRFTLADLAEELSDRGDRLDAFTGDGAVNDIRAVFSWSYRALSADAARLYRLLGLHPGPDISVAAAASLAALPVKRVRPLLAELTRLSLIIEHTPGRYTFHDLLRAYATELARIHDSDRERRAAIHRLLDHYLHTAQPAAQLLQPSMLPLTLAPPQPGVSPERIADPNHALAWFTAEYPVLLAAIHHAARTGFDTHTVQLSPTTWAFLHRQGHWHDQLAAGHAAVSAAERLADLSAQARAHRSLANAHIGLHRFDDAYADLQRALALDRRARNQAGQGHSHYCLALMYGRERRYADALDHAQRSLDLYRAIDDHHRHARALNQVGWYQTLLGNHRSALVYCEQALAILQDLGDRSGEADTWDSLGYAHHHLGHHTEAVACYERTLTVYLELGNRSGAADTLTHLGDAHQCAGDAANAHNAWRRALAIFDDLGDPQADEIRAKLGQEPPSPRPN
jgi:DNA-binding SARP family transcriptional activator/tetratricopeptide (TPR) repeat protein